MKRNIGKNLKGTKGITLVALVVTIIVLLILAGVALSSVLSQDGIFHRAEQATDKYGQAKARETLELALSEAQMQKYEEGLTEEQLDNKINEIGELLPKEKPDHPELQNVIVDGHIFEIDRSVPKIVDYIGPADGVVITAVVNGLSNGWMKPDEVANISVTGRIKTYSGGNITTVSATKNETEISDFSIDLEGKYTISNITKDTTIVINAKDSNNKENSRTIPITIKVDNIPPVVDTIDISKTEGLKISFSATGHDNETGINHFNYTITSTQDTTLEGIPENQRIGTFWQGQDVEIQTTATGNREETIYTIKVTATDNANNTTLSQEARTTDITVIDGITVEQAKELIKDIYTLHQYIGTKVIDYNPPAGGTYRVFYFDSKGEFGRENTIWIKRDLDISTSINSSKHTNHSSSDNGTVMKLMNPQWASSEYSEINTVGEKIVSYLCDPKEWENYKSDFSSYAIGSPSLEMYCKAYSSWVGDYETGLMCKLGNPAENGYVVGSGYPSYIPYNVSTNNGSLKYGPHGIFGTGMHNDCFLSSMNANGSDRLFGVHKYNDEGVIDLSIEQNQNQWIGVSPVAPLDK